MTKQEITKLAMKLCGGLLFLIMCMCTWAFNTLNDNTNKIEDVDKKHSERYHEIDKKMTKVLTILEGKDKD